MAESNNFTRATELYLSRMGKLLHANKLVVQTATELSDTFGIHLVQSRLLAPLQANGCLMHVGQMFVLHGQPLSVTHLHLNMSQGVRLDIHIIQMSLHARFMEPACVCIIWVDMDIIYSIMDINSIHVGV